MAAPKRYLYLSIINKEESMALVSSDWQKRLSTAYIDPMSIVDGRTRNSIVVCA